MTDKTRYCELCEAAQREIAELDRRVRALDFVVDELKAENKRLESVVYTLNCESAAKSRKITFMNNISVDLLTAEIAELKASAFSNIETTKKAAKFLADLENVDAEIARLKAERLAPIDETVRAIGNIFAFYNNLHPEPADARDFIGAFANQLRDRLTEIRAKYEQGE